MKWNEMQNLFIGYNENEDFRILICAFDEIEAQELARNYGFDANIGGPWTILELDANANDVHFDCDYVIA